MNNWDNFTSCSLNKCLWILASTTFTTTKRLLNKPIWKISNQRIIQRLLNLVSASRCLSKKNKIRRAIVIFYRQLQKKGCFTGKIVLLKWPFGLPIRKFYLIEQSIMIQIKYWRWKYPEAFWEWVMLQETQATSANIWNSKKKTQMITVSSLYQSSLKIILANNLRMKLTLYWKNSLNLFPKNKILT